MKIGELAKAAQTQNETIRYYEREGLLPQAARTGANYRVYDDTHVHRLAFIRHCRSLDMTLDEIRTLLHFRDAPDESCADVNSLLDEHIEHVVKRVGELKALEKELRQLRSQCRNRHVAADCGILGGLQRAAQAQLPLKASRVAEAHISGVHQQVGARSKA